MALSYGSNTYAGQLAKGMIADMLLTGDTISGGYITVHPAVKGKEVIQTITTDAIFQANSDSFDASGTTTIGERLLTLVNLKSQDKIGINVLLSAWQSAMQADSANDKDLPTDMANFVIDYKAKQIANQIDELIWRGDTTLTSNLVRKWHNGILTLAEADSAVTKYPLAAVGTSQYTITGISVGATTTLTMAATTGLQIGDKITCKNFAGADAATLNGLSFSIISTTATTIVIDAVTTGLTITDNTDAAYINFINEANVLTALAQAHRVSRVQDREASDFKIFAPVHVCDAYIGASLAASTGQGHAYQDAAGLNYKGIPIVKCKYFPDNTLFTSPVSNLHFGTDLVSDQNEVMAKYMKEVTFEDEYRFSAKFSSSVNYGFANQIKMIRPA